MTDITNRHPIDRLADIRQMITVLEAEYAAIRSQVLAGEIDPIGQEYMAIVVTHDTRRTDFAKAERLLSREVYNQIISTTPVKRVQLRASTQPTNDD